MPETPNPDHYAFIRAIIDGGDLRWEYQLNGSDVVGRMNHDEDISSWTPTEVKRVTRSALSVEKDDPVQIEVVYA